jgi:AcrR family transcriptional regulator
MPTPARILRDFADDLPNVRPKWSTRELEREDRILSTAKSLLARYGRANVTFTTLAFALRLAPATIRRHFADLDSILFELITRHLMAISRAMGDVPFPQSNRQAALRAAYVACTRTAFSAPIESHTLLLRDRHALPPDLLEHVEKLRTLLGQTLGNAHDETVLALLDNPFIQIDQIETMFAALVKPKAPPQKIRTIKYQKPGRPTPPHHPGAACPPPPQARAGPAPPGGAVHHAAA